MKEPSYIVQDGHHGRRWLTSAPVALLLWAVLIASNLWWLYRAGATHAPVMRHELKLDADGAF